MTWKYEPLYCIMQNFLHDDATYDAAITGDTPLGGYALANVVNYIPGSGARFATQPAASKQITFTFGAARRCDAFAVINVNSMQELPVAISGDDLVLQAQIKVQVERAASTIVQSYMTLTRLNHSQYAGSLFGYFASQSDTVWRFRFAIDENDYPGPEIGAASVGCILLGKKFSFPRAQLIPHERSAVSGSIYLGRDFGSGAVFTRESGKRIFTIRTHWTAEGNRARFEGDLLGRGSPRLSGGTQLARRRLDIPTALMSPEMFFSGSSTYGGCLFGRFTELRTTMVAQDSVFTELTFEEMV